MCTVLTCLSRENAASMDIGVGLVSMTSPSTSFISYCPRGASGIRNAKNATTRAGMPRMKYDQRHPSSPPAMAAMRTDERRADGPDQQTGAHRGGADATAVPIG